VILDGHPELACPPETNIAKLIGQFGFTWSLLDPASRGEELSASGLRSVSAPDGQDPLVRQVARYRRSSGGFSQDISQGEVYLSLQARHGRHWLGT